MTGRSDRAGTWAFQTETSGADGRLSGDGWCAGCYLHGLFENDNFRQGILAALEERRCSTLPIMMEMTGFNRQAEYDKLAALLREYLDIDRLKALCNLMLCLQD